MEDLRSKRQIIIFGFVFFNLVIVLIWVVSTLPSHVSNIYTLNAHDLLSVMSEKNIDNLEDSLSYHIANNFPEQNSQYAQFTISIRPETFQKYNGVNAERALFIVDVEEIKMTYNVDMDLADKGMAIISCPISGLMRYKDQVCEDRSEEDLRMIDEILEDF